MDSLGSDNFEYMEIDDTDSVSGQSARQVPPQKPMESVVEVLQNIINKDTIPKENLKRAVEIKESEQQKLLEQWNEAKESLAHCFREMWFLEGQLTINAEERARMGGGMPFQKPSETEAEILEKIFVNKDSILQEILKRAVEINESERGKLLEQWKEETKSLERWITEMKFLEDQLQRNAEERALMGSGMPFQNPVETVEEILKKIFIDKDSILKEHLERALKNKLSEREKLFEQWKEAKKYLEHWVTETWFIGNQLNRIVEEFELMGGRMPFQKPSETVAEILEKSFINKDSILQENLERAFKNKVESERDKLLEQWKKAQESLNKWVSKTSFFEYQLHINAKIIERMSGTMQADCLEVWKGFQGTHHLVS